MSDIIELADANHGRITVTLPAAPASVRWHVNGWEIDTLPPHDGYHVHFVGEGSDCCLHPNGCDKPRISMPAATRDLMAAGVSIRCRLVDGREQWERWDATEWKPIQISAPGPCPMPVGVEPIRFKVDLTKYDFRLEDMTDDSVFVVIEKRDKQQR